MANETFNFSINSFRGKLGDGGLRPNQFAVQISLPPGVPAGLQDLPGTSPFLVSVAELPGQTIGVAPVYYRGREIKMPGDKVFAPFTCTAINDNSLIIRNSLEKWMTVIEGNRNKEGIIDPTQYMATIFVKQLNRNGKMLREYRLIDAFPIDISPIGLDFAANDQLSTFSMTFQYQYFTIHGYTAPEMLNL
jgi:hypothetical protein